MTDRPESLIVLGKTNITPLEKDCLHTFGYYLATLGQELLTVDAPGVAKAVANGYIAGGGNVLILDKGQLPHDDVIVFIDPTIQHSLDDKIPDWVNRPWLTVQNDQIAHFVSVYVSVLADMGHDIAA